MAHDLSLKQNKHWQSEETFTSCINTKAAAEHYLQSMWQRENDLEFTRLCFTVSVLLRRVQRPHWLPACPGPPRVLSALRLAQAFAGAKKPPVWR